MAAVSVDAEELSLDDQSDGPGNKGGHITCVGTASYCCCTVATGGWPCPEGSCQNFFDVYCFFDSPTLASTFFTYTSHHKLLGSNKLMQVKSHLISVR
eukprot:265875-Ditylum_brightwellii.AAC.1